MILWFIFISVKGSSSTWIWVYHYLNINDWSWKEITKEHSYNLFQITNFSTLFSRKRFLVTYSWFWLTHTQIVNEAKSVTKEMIKNTFRFKEIANPVVHSNIFIRELMLKRTIWIRQMTDFLSFFFFIQNANVLHCFDHQCLITFGIQYKLLKKGNW